MTFEIYEDFQSKQTAQICKFLELSTVAKHWKLDFTSEILNIVGLFTYL